MAETPSSSGTIARDQEPLAGAAAPGSGVPLKLEQALDVVSDVFVLYDREFRIVYHNEANKAAMRAVGLDPESAVGKVVWDVLPLRGTVAERESLRALTDRVETEWEESYGPVRLRGRAFPTADGGMIVVAQNITEEARAKDALQSTAARANALQQVTAAFARTLEVREVAQVTLTHGLATVGAVAGAVYTLQPGADELVAAAHMGLPPEATAAYPSLPLAGPSVVADAIRSGRPVYLPERDVAISRYPIYRALHSHIAADAWAAVPLVHDGRTLGALVVGYTTRPRFDTDERGFIEALGRQCAQAMDRARLYEAERKARAAAEDANRVKAEFLTAMSHELRTPLNAIGGYAELLSMGIRGPVTEEQKADLARIRRSQLHLLGIINDILNFARLDAGQLEVEIERVAVHDVVAALDPLIQPLVHEKGLTFRVEPSGSELAVMADPEKLRQALLNLLANAVKFTETGGLIELSALAGGETVEISVRDTGIGIPDDRLDEIFQPFVQANRSLSHPTAGTGLGLAITRDLLRLMNGDVRATSERGAGSTFTVTLPRAE